jgi:hypothetical protein
MVAPCCRSHTPCASPKQRHGHLLRPPRGTGHRGSAPHSRGSAATCVTHKTAPHTQRW